MQSQDFYLNDTFGLQTLDRSGRLTRLAVDGIEHAQWLHNQTNFETYILPLLTWIVIPIQLLLKIIQFQEEYKV